MRSKLLLKIAIGLVSILLVSVLLLFLFLSPVCKWAIQKYDKEFLGREITLGGFWLNLFTGTMEIKEFTLYEKDDKTPFVQFASLKTSINLKKAIKGEYDIHNFIIDAPKINVLQREAYFNFSDIIDRFASDSTSAEPTPADTMPVKWRLHNLQITNADIAYTNRGLGNTIAFSKLAIKSPVLAWDNPELLLKLDFDINSGGVFKNLIRFNTNTQDYALKLNIKDFNLGSWYPYMREMIKVKSFEGELNTILSIAGNAARSEELGLKGVFNLENINLVDPKGYPLFDMGKMALKIDSIQVKDGLYELNSLAMDRLFCVYEMYPKGSNFDRLFDAAAAETPPASADTASVDYDNPFMLLTGYTKDVVDNQDINKYSAKDVSITNSKIIFRDYTLQQKFNFELSSLNMLAANLRSTSKRLNLSINSVLNRSGKLAGKLAINPKDFKNLDLSYSVKGLRMSDMNPYMLYYIAHPFLDGVVNYTCETHIDARHNLKSENKLNIQTVQVGKKQKNKTATDLPVKLAIALLRDYKGNINLDLPVEGNLDDPKYKLGKVIWGVVKNIFVKAAMAPYQLLAAMFGGKEEELKELKIEYVQLGFTDKQEKTLDKVARVLTEKPDLIAEFVQVSNNELEQEEWGMFALKQSYLNNYYGRNWDSITQELVDSVNGLDNQDTLFVGFVNAKLNAAEDWDLPLQEKMRKIISAEQRQQLTLRAMERRNRDVRQYLQVKKKVPVARFKVVNTTKQDAANTETVSKYLINYAAK